MTDHSQHSEQGNCAFCGGNLTPTHAAECGAFTDGAAGQTWKQVTEMQRMILAREMYMPVDTPMEVLQRLQNAAPLNRYWGSAQVHKDEASGDLLLAGATTPGLIWLFIMPGPFAYMLACVPAFYAARSAYRWLRYLRAKAQKDRPVYPPRSV